MTVGSSLSVSSSINQVPMQPVDNSKDLQPLSRVGRLKQSELLSFTGICVGGVAAGVNVAYNWAAGAHPSGWVSAVGVVSALWAMKKGREVGEGLDQYKKTIKYEGSLNYFVLLKAILRPTHWAWSHEIIPGKLTLGAQPQLNFGHDKEYAEKGITGVLSLVEDFETKQPSLFTEAVQKKHWKKLNVSNYHVSTPDFLPLSQKKIKQSVEWINRELQKKDADGKEIGQGYVHCKAGVGRSATVVACFLLKYGKKYGVEVKNVDEAIKFVRSKRPATNINKKQKAAIDTYFQSLNAVKA